jgi:DNA-binding transcriptional ArsR family regulator
MAEDPASVDAGALETLFQALADRTRRRMLHRLRRRPLSVSELAAPFSISLDAASKHLKMLERAGLVERSVSGRVHTCLLRGERLFEAERWLQQYRVSWQDRLDALETAQLAPTDAVPEHVPQRSLSDRSTG